jgi:hypothetical protein
MRAHRRGETTKLNPAPQTSGFDGRDHGSPSEVQITRASAAALRDGMGGCIFAIRLDALAVAPEAGAQVLVDALHPQRRERNIGVF